MFSIRLLAHNNQIMPKNGTRNNISSDEAASQDNFLTLCMLIKFFVNC